MAVSQAQLAAMMIKAGFPASQVPTGIAIARAESGLNPQAINHYNTNGTQDYGLFQINSVHSSLLQSGNWSDPQSNVNMAYQVYKNAGNKWTPWSTYNSGAYQRYVSGAQAVTIPPGTSGTNAVNAALTMTPYPGGRWDPMNWPGYAVRSYIPANFQMRLLWFILGLVALLTGLYLTFRRQINGVVGDTAKTAAVAAMA